MRSQLSEGHCFLGGVRRCVLYGHECGWPVFSQTLLPKEKRGTNTFQARGCMLREEWPPQKIHHLSRFKKCLYVAFSQGNVSQINIYLIVCSIKMKAMWIEKCRIRINAMILVGGAVYSKNLQLHNSIWYAKYFQTHFLLLFLPLYQVHINTALSQLTGGR